MSPQKLIRDLRRDYPAAKITVTGSGHLRIKLPGCPVVFAPKTPSDIRSMLNVKAKLKRAQQ